jgi:hypothetical protein
MMQLGRNVGNSVDSFDYQFIFSDIVDGFSRLEMFERGTFQPKVLKVGVDDSQLRYLEQKCLPSVLADLIDLALAIYVADKLSLPKKTRSIKVGIVLPVRHPEILNALGGTLEEILEWYSQDNWVFQFIPRIAKGRAVEYPVSHFQFVEREFYEVALWSGGLDSLAGLCKRMELVPNSHYVLIGTGSNSIMHKTQSEVFKRVIYAGKSAKHLSLVQVPLKAEYEERLSKNRSHRARGVVFLLIGVVGALLKDSNKLLVYENGVGAINLPLPASIGRDHSKAIHPISLIRVSNFISQVIDKKFSIENPFLFETKAQMCSSLKGNPFLAFETISCDQLHRESPIQCGYCSSCLMRRQSLAAAGIKDGTRYLIPHGRNFEQRHDSYLRYILGQVALLESKFETSNVWYELSTE